MYRISPWMLSVALLSACGGASHTPPATHSIPIEQPFANLAVINSEPFPDMYFEHYGVNPTIDTAETPISTFSVDVDTAAYTLARSYLDRGYLPDRSAIRVEEFINRFDYDDAPPKEAIFSIYSEAFPSPNRPGYHVLRLALKGREIKTSQRKPANLVFVVDVSGSMNRENRLGLVKRSLRLLVDQLTEADRVAIVGYGGGARVLLNPTSGRDRSAILAGIDALSPKGHTDAQAGIELGYATALNQLDDPQKYINRVILCSDGVANAGITDADRLYQRIEQEAKAGITLTAVGFGMGHYNDVLMEQLAQKANGQYHYVDRLSEAKRLFVESLTGTLQTIARDVKIQVEFDPQRIARYRLLGYENRQLRTQDFADDRVDAGEIGAGHAVTALYEVKFTNQNGPFAELRVRYKSAEGSNAQLITTSLADDIIHSEYAQASPAARLSLAVAAFAEKLRGAYWVRELSYDKIINQINMLPPEFRERPQVIELNALVAKARNLDHRDDRFTEHMTDFDHVPIVKGP